ncbi:hypothetical protein TSUD_72010 [Trifolium subterraneum]|uniref:Uncharacterized protein n=1 Tax=Trifolium subterraneum TaxID=3900 RepID=A0A2Z6NS55_TRISU|nr:hypothetical protein TSUD_72010 [Trifolium subterraneum]
MCHEGFFPLYSRLNVCREVQIVVDSEAEQEPAAVVAGQSHGGEDGSIKLKCVCSPSKHPGSFRCRQHQDKYVWRNKTIK